MQDLFQSYLPVSLPGGLIPFPFQRRMVEEFLQAIRSGDRHIIMCAGTGAGKTFMSAMIIHYLVQSESLRCVFLVDLNCLIDQAIAEFRQLGIKAVPYQGSSSRSSHSRLQLQFANVIVASVQTLESRRKKQNLREILGDVGLVVADECHTTAFSKAYEALRETYNLGTVFLGLSATIKTQSLGDRYLGRLFHKIIRSPSMEEMIKLGRCVPARMFSPSGILNPATLHIDERTADYDLGEQQEQIKAKYPDIVRSWIEYGEGRSTTAYCPTIESAQGLVDEFLKQGIRAELQTGSTPMGVHGPKEHVEGVVTRASQNYRLDTGITKVVCSVGTQVKGWNLKSLGCIMLVRSTKSLSLFLQIVGRGGRACKNPYWSDSEKLNYLLLDFGGNLERFHPISPNDFGSRDGDYDIEERSPARETTKERSLNEKPAQDEPEDDQEEEGLELYEWFDKTAVKQIAFLRKLKKQAFEQGTSPETAEKAYLKEYGFLPFREWHLGAVFGPFPTKKNRVDYLEYLKKFAPHDYWLQTRMNLEFGNGKTTSSRTIKEKAPWHRTLGVSPKTTLAIAHRAYQKLAKRWHPDLNKSPEAKAAMQVLNKAWEEAQRTLSS